MIIRRATKNDLSILRELYDTAKQVMNQNGNPNQWKSGEPSNTEIINSIEKKEQYLILKNNDVIAAFVFFLGGEPFYDVIHDGKWPNNESYGTIHRVASNGKEKGILSELFKWAEKKSSNLRMDTHKDNSIMNHLLTKNGFIRCGIIYLANKEERIAYAKVNINYGGINE